MCRIIPRREFGGHGRPSAIKWVLAVSTQAHCEIKRDAGLTQMTAPRGASGTLQLTRTSAEHVDAAQSADERPYAALPISAFSSSYGSQFSSRQTSLGSHRFLSPRLASSPQGHGMSKVLW